MLTLAWDQHMVREVLGQLVRLVLAGPASVLGRYPKGNSGRVAESAFAPAPVDPRLADLLGDVPDGPAVLDIEQVRRLYDRIAPMYDVGAAAYGWLGTGGLVRRAIAELRLEPGDTVVELGAGTGRNLLELAKVVGSTGRVVGVDLSPRMLEQARRKIDREGLTNVELVEADMSTFAVPPGVDGVLSTFALEMAPDYDQIIRSLVSDLDAGARISICGLRHPERWPEWIVRLGSLLNRPFGVSEAYRSHRPWVTLRAAAIETMYDEALGGAAYLCVGSVPPADT